MILLDTHVWIWLASNPEKLSAEARGRISRASRRGIAAISAWELAMSAAKGRVTLDRAPLDWIEQSLTEFKIEIIPLTPAISVVAAGFGGGFHGDPADRLIAATALALGVPLVSKDAQLRGCPQIKAVW